MFQFDMLPPLKSGLMNIAKMAVFTSPELIFRNILRNSLGRVRLSATGSGRRMYRAAICTEFGKPLLVQDLPEQDSLASGQIKIDVHRASVNFADLMTVKGLYQEKADVPFTSGAEFAGRVVAVGSAVHHLVPGSRVCGVNNLGAHAEQIVMEARAVIPIPDHLDFSDAAALLISYGTAYMALKQQGNIKKWETVLVTAAAGGMGLAAVHLASKVFGAKVIAACGGAEKCSLVKQHGADVTIDYNTENICDRVKEITGNKGVNIALDAVGGQVMIDCVRSLSYGGRVLVVGFTCGDIPRIPANLLHVKCASAIGVCWGSTSYRKPDTFAESVMTILKYASEGKIKPYLSKTFLLEDINEAFNFVQERKSTGKVIIKVR